MWIGNGGNLWNKALVVHNKAMHEMKYTIGNANTHAQVTINTLASDTNTNHLTKHSNIHPVHINQIKSVRYHLRQVTYMEHLCVNILEPVLKILKTDLKIHKTGLKRLL